MPNNIHHWGVWNIYEMKHDIILEIHIFTLGLKPFSQAQKEKLSSSLKWNYLRGSIHVCHISLNISLVCVLTHILNLLLTRTLPYSPIHRSFLTQQVLFNRFYNIHSNVSRHLVQKRILYKSPSVLLNPFHVWTVNKIIGIFILWFPTMPHPHLCLYWWLLFSHHGVAESTLL